MKEYKPSNRAPAVIRVWTLISAIPWGILTAVAFNFNSWVGVGLTVLFIIFITAVNIISPKFIRTFRLRICEERFVLTYGLIVEKTYIFPNTRLIYISQSATPVSAAFGLCTIRLNAVRRRLFLPLIEDSIASEIISQLKRMDDFAENKAAPNYGGEVPD